MTYAWPSKENPIASITFELIVGFEEGQPVYRRGQVYLQEELVAVETALEPLRPSPASVSSITMGEVHMKLADGSLVVIRPVFHPSPGIYKGLFKVDNFDYPMPDSFADMLNKWRQMLRK
jgi:hypothetical protein